VIWRVCAFQDNDDGEVDLGRCQELGPFQFEGRAYVDVLTTLRRVLAERGR